MSDLATTYQHIADILSFEVTNNELEKKLNHHNFNWDPIVVEGSKHLVLPAIYCRLKARQLLHILPEELNNYLKDITSINRNRNFSIIEQAHSISRLFDEHQIKHAFLKGTALILSDSYDDVGERMIGDIDILVDSNQLSMAFDLLKKDGYIPIEQTLGNDFFEHQHLPRLKTEKHICAVELHKKLFTVHEDEDLKSTNIIALRKRKNNISIPILKHLLKHNILNYQINDKGYLYSSISFRSAYDTIVLIRSNHPDSKTFEDKVFRHYFNLLHLFFRDIQKLSKFKKSFSTSFYLYKLKHLRFYKVWNKILKLFDFFRILINRIGHALTNKSYRKALFTDRKRVYKYFMSVLKNS